MVGKGADIEAKKHDGWTALMIAAQNLPYTRPSL